MNWDLDQNWKCEICGAVNLAWSIIHGHCFCTVCDAPYVMLADKKEYERLTTPRLLVKEAFVEPARKWWVETHRGLDQLTPKDWIRVGVPESEFEEEE